MASLTSLLRGLGTSGMQYYPPPRRASVNRSNRGVYEVTTSVMLEKTPSGWVITGATNQASTITKRILIDG